MRWLRRTGYRIVERNVVTKAGEIDVVGWDGDILCFIEVKARSTERYGPAVAGITARKRSRLQRAAKLYAQRRELRDIQFRFDVLGLDRRKNGWQYTLIKNAFEASGS